MPASFIAIMYSRPYRLVLRIFPHFHPSEVWGHRLAALCLKGSGILNLVVVAGGITKEYPELNPATKASRAMISQQNFSGTRRESTRDGGRKRAPKPEMVIKRDGTILE
ncbi:hypothetical protein TNCV_7261 [Trichonephila clavipes]|nr:hypothetical protein TNCV_7261 [Trichonephila clavipes]